MTVTVKHNKTNAISDWTQAQLDEQIALGNFAEGTVLADIVLPSDWNNDHTLTGIGTMAEQNANNVAITGGTINNASIGATTASTGAFTSVTTPSVTATTNNLTLSAISTGNINLNTPNGTAFKVLPVTSASSNWLQVGNPSTTVIRLGPAGTTVADFRILAPTFTSFHTGSSADGLSDGSQQFRVNHTASAVNYVQVTGAATTANPAISTQGSDTNISMSYIAKGTGQHIFATNGTINNQQLRVSHTASAVNYVQVTGATTGNRASISAQGSDTNIGVNYQTKGSGQHIFYTNAGTAISLVTGSGGANYGQVNGAASGSAPSFLVAGSDTNIDLSLTPKGTGNVRFGTRTATSDVAITGYLEIKDSGGTIRKLAIID